MTCPVPGCRHNVPDRGVFCVEHYFALPRAYTRLIFRMKFEAERTADPDTKAHLSEQRDAYIHAAIRQLPDTGGEDAA